jgi:hypothetical protein
MRARPHTYLFAAAALAAPSLALGWTLEGFYGIAAPPGTSFESSSGAANPNVFKDTLQIGGADAMFDLGLLQFGAIIDTTWAGSSATQTALGALGGVKLAFGSLRLDLMGELGGHHYGNLESAVNGGNAVWFAYLGLRPGLAYKFGAPDKSGFLLGVWTFARWDLSSNRVPVTSQNVGEVGSVELGGSTYGAALRFGYEF